MQTFTRLTGIIVVSASLYACNDKNNDVQTLETLEQKASYSFGVDVATRLKQQGVNLDVNALNQGIKDAYTGSKLALTEEESLQAKTAFQTQLRDAMLKEQSVVGEKNLAEGKAFLEEKDTVSTHYKGTLIDGREFDSSYKRDAPASFPVKGVIKGWTEALQLMHVGDKWQLFVPSELAYGATKRSELIEANSTLIFEIELLSIEEK
jgi:FKBP-type peptidyl-prolyl cis-trans isomerase FklB